VLITGPLYGGDKLEAYACGKPVIASKVGGLKDLVINRETGLLVDLENVEQLARDILHLWNDNGRAEEMGLKGKRFVENFAIEEIVNRLEKLYRDVVSDQLHKSKLVN